MEMFRSRAKICAGLRLLVLVAFLFAALFCVSVFSAQGETYETYVSITENSLTIPVYFGDTAAYPKYSQDGKYFRIVSYEAETPGGIGTFSLVEDGRFTAEPGDYSLPADINAIPCYQNGEPIGGNYICSGTIKVKIKKKDLEITFTEEALTKVYGEEISTLSWDFKKESDRDESLEIRFSCDGFAADASVRNDYKITVDSVWRGEEDCTAYYKVNSSIVESEGSVLLTVAPAPITFLYDEPVELPFNHYLQADGESVLSLEQAGANGDTLIAYFRLKEEHPTLLTVGESYEIECYRFERRPAEGDPTDDLSDYEVTVTCTANTVSAKTGTLTLHQDPALTAAHPWDYSYFYCPVTFDYLDPMVKDCAGSIKLEDISYYETTLTLFCSISGAPISGAIPCGNYPLSLRSFGCEALTEIIFDALSLSVTPRRFVYEEKAQAEYATGEVFEKTVTLSFDGVSCTFVLTADMTGTDVGDVRQYLSYTSSDENFELSFSPEATVTVVVRKTGVSFYAPKNQSVVYGQEYTLAVPYLNYGTVDAETLNESVAYTYTASGSALVKEGLPENAGSYSVTCTLVSDRYYVRPVTLSLTIKKKGIVAYYNIASAEKPYGTTVDFDASPAPVVLVALYEYDEKTKKEDREKSIDPATVAFGGRTLTSEGGVATAVVGRYDYDFSRITSQNHEIKKVIVYDLTAEKETTQYAVVKAYKPTDLPSFTIRENGNSLIVEGPGKIKAELSEKQNMSSAKTASGEGAATFAKLVYGRKYYFRARVEDLANYEEPGEWCAVKSKVLTFAAPSVEVSLLKSDGMTLIATLEGVEEGSVFLHRVDSGEWSEGLEITGLKPSTNYTISVRMKNDLVAGEANLLKIRTLAAPPSEDQIEPTFERESGAFSVSADVANLEYMLLDESGEPLLEEWVTAKNLPKLQADTKYLLQVRYAATETAAASDIREIEIDTHEAEKPFTIVGFLSDWFLVIIGGVLVIAGIVFTVIFVRAKKKTEKEEIGGKRK